MKRMKLYCVALATLMLVVSCGTATKNGALIGGGGGAALGALVGGLIGKNTAGTLIGAAVGGAVGTTAGALIGKKMDKAKAAAAQVSGAEVSTVTDANGLEAVKVTFDSGILFTTGSSVLSTTAKKNLTDFTNNVLKPYSDCDVAIMGYTDNAGWKNSTAEQSKQKNLALSQNRADAVKTFLLSSGAGSTQIKSSTGFGEENPVADNSTAAGKAENRRVEVYLYASQSMINAANNGTLQ